MIKLVLLRHGESTWNKENLYTGWTDVDLSEKGLGEAHEAGKLLREGGYLFDVAHTSVLKRAIRTLWIALDEMDLMWIPDPEHLAAQRAHVRRVAGPEQGPNRRAVRRTTGEAVAALLRRAAPGLDQG